MLEHRLPFDPSHGTRSSAGHPIDFQVKSIGGRGLLLLQSSMQAAVQEALVSEVDLQLPGPQMAVRSGDRALLWLSPAEWMLELPAAEACSVQEALTRRLATPVAAITDMGDALACFEIAGARAAEHLMCGCSLDLRSHAFPSNRVSRTAVADIPTVIWNPGNPDRFRCLIDVSFAKHFWEWLLDVQSQARSEMTPSITG